MNICSNVSRVLKRPDRSQPLKYWYGKRSARAMISCLVPERPTNTYTAMYTSYRTHTQTQTNKICSTSGCHELWHAYFTLTGTIPLSFLCQDLKLLTTLSQWTPKTKKNNKPRQKLESYVIGVSCCCIHPPTKNFFSLCSYKSTNTDATRLRATLSSEFTCFTNTKKYKY